MIKLLLCITLWVVSSSHALANAGETQGRPVILASATEQQEHDETELSTENEAPSPKKRKRRRKTSAFQSEVFVGIGLGLPEILPLDVTWKFSDSFAIRGYAAPALVNVDLPLYISSYDQRGILFRYKVPYQELKAKITYGPHVGIEGLWFARNTSFYVSAGAGIRQITAQLNDGIEYYICSANDSNCGNGTPATLKVNGSVTSTSMLGRLSIGWLWDLGPSTFLNLTAIGIAMPLNHSLKQELEASFGGSDAAESNSATSSLNSFLDPYEAVIAQALYDSYGAEYDSLPLPITGVTFGVRF